MNKNINKLFIYFIYLYLKKIILFIKIKNIFLIYNFKSTKYFINLINKINNINPLKSK